MFRMLTIALPLALTSVAVANPAEKTADAKAITFEKLDADGDQKLTVEEVASVDALKKDFKKIDADANGTIEVVEFDTWEKKKTDAAKTPAH